MWLRNANTYQEDESRKDQGRALLDEGFVPLLCGKDDTAVVDAGALAVGKDKGSCKAPSKSFKHRQCECMFPVGHNIPVQGRTMAAD
jgi:hypothetical protein